MSREEVHQEVTNQEKYIYNTYLRIFRSRQNKPYKLRKDFNNFLDNEAYYFIKKLGMFFNKYPHINIDVYFKSPYDLYPDVDTIYDLKFYASPRAIKVYSLYMKHMDQQDPDTDYHIQFGKDSLLYIFKFCRDNKMKLNEYLNHKTGDLPTFVLHLRDRYVSIYTLFAFDSFDEQLDNVSPDRLNFTIGESFVSSLAIYRTRYYNSIKFKRTIKQGIEKIKKILLTACS